MTLSDKLVEKLRKEQFELERFQISSPVDQSLEPTRQLAEKRLLALTNPAIQALGDILENSNDEKSIINAANSILDRSPATKEELAPQAEQALPPLALKILMEGMSRMMGMALAQPAPQPETKLIPKKRKTHAK